MILMTELPDIITGDERLAVLRAGGFVQQAAYYAAGKLVQKETQGFFVHCNVQPMGGRDLMILPEGQRERENLAVWAAGGRTLAVADQIIRLGKTYQVQQVEDWGSYCKATIMVLDPQEASLVAPLGFLSAP